MEGKYCPHCKSKKPMVRAGFSRGWNNYEKQRWLCTNKRCRRFSVNPLKEK